MNRTAVQTLAPTLLDTDCNFNMGEMLKLLDLSDTTSIYSVIGRMEILMLLFEKDPYLRGLNPFLKTYYFVTRHVVEKYVRDGNSFEDFETLQKLDIKFASYFFNPVRDLIMDKHLPHPWKTFFQYSLGDTGSPFLKMLLGINAHINGDLFITLHDVDTRNKHDFMMINEILLEVISDVMGYLAVSEKDFLGLGSFILRDFTKYEFKNVVVKWRNTAWNKFQKTHTSGFDQTKIETYQNAEEIGVKLIEIFTNKSLDGVIHFIQNLNQL